MIMAEMDDQEAAKAVILGWANAEFDPENWCYALLGAAGMGKTYTLKSLLPEVRGAVAVTAPTNKAVKVLMSLFQKKDEDSYSPDCCTIHSLLGLALSANGELKKLQIPDNPINISKLSMIVVDEASMLNLEIFEIIRRSAIFHKVKILFLGDPYQLPPVKEAYSPALRIDNIARLTRVRRHNNAILDLATAVREAQKMPVPTVNFPKIIAGRDEIWLQEQGTGTFMQQVYKHLGSLISGEAKVIAWRNATVDNYNLLIRSAIFSQQASSSMWLPTDRISALSPCVDLTIPKEDRKMRNGIVTDDEGTVEQVEVVPHPTLPEYLAWEIQAKMDSGRYFTFHCLHEKSKRDFDAKLAQLLNDGKKVGKWKAYWEFVEEFHSIRHAYATTAHRSQGSTYRYAFVDWKDILINRNRLEAFQCLYVAVSRPSTRLFLS